MPTLEAEVKFRGQGHLSLIRILNQSDHYNQAKAKADGKDQTNPHILQVMGNPPLDDQQKSMRELL